MTRLCKRFLLTLTSTLALSLLAAPAAAQQPSRDAADRFEFSFFFGGSVGHKFGSPSTSCIPLSAPTVLDGCNPLGDIGDRSSTAAGPGGIFPGEGGAELRNFLTSGSLDPQNGVLFGFRAGYDINPKWQVEFTYNYAQTDMSISNLAVLEEAQAIFNASARGEKNFVLADDGKPRGNQQMYLFNVNYHFLEDQRVVPYVGFGAGAVKWYNGPNAVAVIRKNSNFGLDPRLAAFTKSSGSDTAFALDLAGGVKIHATRHFGIRIEVMNLVSFPRFNNEFRSIDVSGQCAAGTGADCSVLGGAPGGVVDVSGTLRQKAEFNQLIFTSGVFWRF